MKLFTPHQRLGSIIRTMRGEARNHRRYGRELEAAELEHFAAMLEDVHDQLALTGMAPEGWRLVPTDPTADMITALYSQVRDVACYQQMLREAPAPGGVS